MLKIVIITHIINLNIKKIKANIEEQIIIKVKRINEIMQKGI